MHEGHKWVSGTNRVTESVKTRKTGIEQIDKMAHHLFRARTIIVGKKGVSEAMNSLSRIMQNEKQIKDIQLNRYYEKPTVKRRRKKYESSLRIYNFEMERKISFLSRKDRSETPWS